MLFFLNWSIFVIPNSMKLWSLGEWSGQFRAPVPEWANPFSRCKSFVCKIHVSLFPNFGMFPDSFTVFPISVFYASTKITSKLSFYIIELESMRMWSLSRNFYFLYSKSSILKSFQNHGRRARLYWISEAVEKKARSSFVTSTAIEELTGIRCMNYSYMGRIKVIYKLWQSFGRILEHWD